MTLFRNKYRIETTRLRDWDYAAGGWYYVTVCTENKRYYFGRVIDAQVDLSLLGKYAEACWQSIPLHHKNVTLDEFIVMPNHVHGIIVIDAPGCMPPLRKKGERRIPKPLSAVSPKSSSLAAIMRSYKSAVTTWAHEQDLNLTGSLDFMIGLSVVRIPLKTSGNISGTIRSIGKRTRNFVSYSSET
jgi:putative transposase